VNPRSQSRIISGLRGFFNYLIFEEYIKTNPLELIEVRKLEENYQILFLWKK